MEPDAPQYKGLRLRQKAGYVMAALQLDAEELQKAWRAFCLGGFP